MRVLALLLVGLALGTIGAMVQTHVVVVGAVTVPTGAILALGAAVPVARAGAWWAGSRWGAIGVAVGWLIATLAMATTTPAGDVVLANGTRQVAYLMVGALMLSAACGYPLLPADDGPEQVDPNPVDAGPVDAGPVDAGPVDADG